MEIELIEYKKQKMEAETELRRNIDKAKRDREQATNENVTMISITATRAEDINFCLQLNNCILFSTC